MRLNVTNVKLFQEATFEKAQVPNMLSLEVPGLAENRPSLLKGDKIFARVSQTGKGGQTEGKEYEGVVHQILEKQICVGFSKELRDKWE